MQFAMVGATNWYGKLIADFHAERPWLGKTQMMGVGRAAATDDAGLRRHELAMLFVAATEFFGQDAQPARR
jgi:hypothetical protein